MSNTWYQTLADVARADEAEAAWNALVLEDRERKIAMARVLRVIQLAKHYCVRGCASIGEFVEKSGYAAQYGRDLAATGALMEQSARVERLLRESRLSIQAAGAIERVVREVPDVSLDWWLDRAMEITTRALVKLAIETLESWRLGGVPQEMMIRLSPTGKKEFERAQAVAMNRTHEVLTAGQTVEVMTRLYLDTFDPDWNLLGKHKVRGTRSSADAHSRWIPAEVKREVRLRDRDQCCVPFCDHRAWIAFAHAITSFAEGGTNDKANIFQLCQLHNWMMVEGYLQVGGTADDPLFLDKERKPYLPPGWTQETADAEARAAAQPPPEDPPKGKTWDDVLAEELAQVRAGG